MQQKPSIYHPDLATSMQRLAQGHGIKALRQLQQIEGKEVYPIFEAQWRAIHKDPLDPAHIEPYAQYLAQALWQGAWRPPLLDDPFVGNATYGAFEGSLAFSRYSTPFHHILFERIEHLLTQSLAHKDTSLLSTTTAPPAELTRGAPAELTRGAPAEGIRFFSGRLHCYVMDKGVLHHPIMYAVVNNQLDYLLLQDAWSVDQIRALPLPHYKKSKQLKNLGQLMCTPFYGKLYEHYERSSYVKAKQCTALLLDLATGLTPQDALEALDRCASFGNWRFFDATIERFSSNPQFLQAAQHRSGIYKRALEKNITQEAFECLVPPLLQMMESWEQSTDLAQCIGDAHPTVARPKIL